MVVGGLAAGKWVDSKSTAYVNVVCQQDCSPGKPLRVEPLTNITTRAVNQHKKGYNNIFTRKFTAFHLLYSRK